MGALSAAELGTYRGSSILVSSTSQEPTPQPTGTVPAASVHGAQNRPAPHRVPLQTLPRSSPPPAAGAASQQGANSARSREESIQGLIEVTQCDALALGARPGRPDGKAAQGSRNTAKSSVSKTDK